jgi:hypothetical protein
MLSNVMCIDFEASSLGRRSFPIEVAIAGAGTGAAQSWLIQPTPLWLATGTWSEDSEALHGLSLARIAAEGKPAATVARALAEALFGKTTLSDNAGHDQAWLEMLFTAGGRATPFKLEDFGRFATGLITAAGQRPDIAMMRAEAEAHGLFPERHRAEPDARRNAEVLRQIVGIPGLDPGQGRVMAMGSARAACPVSTKGGAC